MSDFLAKGISAGLGILKSVASSVICQWYKNNVVIRHRVGRSAWNPEIFVLLKANSTMTIAQMKWDLEIQGAPYTRSTMSSGYGSSGKNLTDEQPEPNERADPTGRLPTFIAVVIATRTKGPFPQTIDIDMNTPTELGLSHDRDIPASADGKVPLYGDVPNALIAKFRRFWGYDDDDKVEGGFKNSSYPGPVILGQGDMLILVIKATDNFDKPSMTYNHTKGYVTGTLTYQLAETMAQRSPAIENVVPQGL